jgi:hypothetical protein
VRLYSFYHGSCPACHAPTFFRHIKDDPEDAADADGLPGAHHDPACPWWTREDTYEPMAEHLRQRKAEQSKPS